MELSKVLILSFMYWLSTVISMAVSPDQSLVAIFLPMGVVVGSIAVCRWSILPAIVIANIAIRILPIFEYNMPLSAVAGDLVAALVLIILWQKFSHGRAVIDNARFAFRVAAAMAFIVIPLFALFNVTLMTLQAEGDSNFREDVIRVWRSQLIAIFFLGPLLAQTFRAIEAKTLKLPPLKATLKQLAPHAAIIVIAMIWFGNFYQGYTEILLLVSLAGYVALIRSANLATFSLTALIVLLMAEYMSHLDLVGISVMDGDFLTLTFALGFFAREWFLLIQFQELRRLVTDEASHSQLAKDEALRTTDAMFEALNRLSLSRDNETGNHILRTQHYVRAIAEKLQSSSPAYSEQLTNRFIATLFKAAPLHDIGKVGIPDSILLKPGKLSDEQWDIMKTHAVIGERVLTSAAGEFTNFDLSIAGEVAGGHHEKWDGTGYPRGLKGSEIPLSARIMAIADVYDALTTARVYKAAWTHEKAIDEIQMLSGSHFDPTIVEAVLDIQNELLSIAQRFKDDEAPKDSNPQEPRQEAAHNPPLSLVLPSQNGLT